MRRLTPRRRDESGATTVVVAILFAAVMLGLAAIGVDTARWYVERERVQKAADSAALAGVVYLPDNLGQAVSAARENARINGFDHNSPDIDVQVVFGERRSQLRVTISSTIRNTFGAAIGVDTATVARDAVADYTSPAPMGSPCNVFGNEPPGGTSSYNNSAGGSPAGDNKSGPHDSQIPSAYRASKICVTDPNFWAGIEGPQTDKQQGDRYSTAPCTLENSTSKALPYGCANKLNAEAVYPEGYFYSIKVPPGAQGTPITVQLYDPAFMNTGPACNNMPNTSSTAVADNLNPYTTYAGDANLRYTFPEVFADGSAKRTDSRAFCTGDFSPGRATTVSQSRRSAPVTSFTVREANDGLDPMAGAPYTGCTAQFAGNWSVPTLAQLRQKNANGNNNSSYSDPMAQAFHQWVSLCTFTPTRPGDHYLQVRTNVALPGSARSGEQTCASTRNGVCQSWSTSFTPSTYMYRGNAAVHSRAGNMTAGEGVNAFGIRLVTAKSDRISVSGWSRMPMFQNVPGSTASFNLLRVLPAAAGQSISFEFFDVADATGSDDKPVSGTVQVVPPLSAGGTQPAPYTKCSGALNDEKFEPLGSDCSVAINGRTHNGQVQRMTIPIPSDYTCKDADLTGCWFQVKINLSNATSITDFTTWDASLQGDPVRLIE